MKKMITTQEALDIVVGHHITLPTESVKLDEAVGRILGQDVLADRAMPPFDRVCMDGIGIDYEQWAAGQKVFAIAGTAAAGEPQHQLADPKQCLEVMTGAPLPLGCDTVIRYEDLTIAEGHATIEIDPRQGQNIHGQGSDRAAGSQLIAKGQRIAAADINIMATVGLNTVDVLAQPRVAIISTGNELVAVADQPQPHQIRRSNSHMLAASLREQGIIATQSHVGDQVDRIEEALTALAEQHDVLLLSGGVSKGKFDYVPEVLANLGFTAHFHKVRQRPGKPFWFGTRGSKVVFAFPGNPMSALACYHRYFVPWLERSMGQQKQRLCVQLAEAVDFKPDLDYMAQATLVIDEHGQCLATVGKGNGSGDLATASQRDGFVVLRRGQERYEQGYVCEFLPFRRHWWI